MGLRRMFILLSSAAAVLAPVPTHAAFPGAPGQIVFVDGGNIYALDASIHQLTFDGKSHNPRWSPDGARIAFDRGGDIHVMEADGTDAEQVTTLGRSYQPAWSAGGHRLVFVHSREEGAPPQLWVVWLRGGPPERIEFDRSVTCGGENPVWSPRGDRIAFEQWMRSPDGHCYAAYNIVVLNLATRRMRTIPRATDPDFTANGRGLFFTSDWEPFEELPFGAGNLSWSSIRGTGRALLTHYICAEGEPCFHEGVASPTSAYPSSRASAHTVSYLDGPICLNGGWSFCTDVEDVHPTDMDWQPVQAGAEPP